jgi:hypothetical protein
MIAPSLLERHIAATRVPPMPRPGGLPGPRLRDRLHRRRRAVAAAFPAGADVPIVLRGALSADAPLVTRLSLLNGAGALRGPLVVAESGGRVLAAAEVESGRALGDPFLPTEAAVTLLRLRAAQLRPLSGR